MSLEKVAESVVAKGRREADAIVKEGGKEVLKILSQADKEVAAAREKYRAMAEKEIAELRSRETSAMEMEARRLRLDARKRIFDSVKQKALDDLTNASRPRKDAILGHLLAKAKRIIPSGKVYCCREDAEPVKRLAGGLVFAGAIDCKGGIIVESGDGSQRVDLTYETIFEQVWDDQLADINAAVFGGER